MSIDVAPQIQQLQKQLQERSAQLLQSDPVAREMMGAIKAFQAVQDGQLEPKDGEEAPPPTEE